MPACCTAGPPQNSIVGMHTIQSGMLLLNRCNARLFNLLNVRQTPRTHKQKIFQIHNYPLFLSLWLAPTTQRLHHHIQTTYSVSIPPTRNVHNTLHYPLFLSLWLAPTTQRLHHHLQITYSVSIPPTRNVHNTLHYLYTSRSIKLPVKFTLASHLST